MFQLIVQGLKWLMDFGMSLIDTVSSWIFSLVPNDFLLDYITPYIYEFFEFITGILLSVSYWFDVAYFSYMLFITLILETIYIIIRFSVWVLVKIIKF